MVEMADDVGGPDAADAPEPTVLARVEGRVGHLTLNRPRAINALDLGMIRQLTAALGAWRDDPAVETVLVDGAGDRGFCAGGDVRGLREQILAGRADLTAGFFRAEYALNAAIAEFPKPIVAIADGVTMGGGIGLAGHATVRLVTERSRLAMPETRIGFTPDVGGSWLLAHAPGRVGEYLALTGDTMDAADAVYAGFADGVIASAELAAPSERFVSSLRSSGGDRGEAPPSRLEAARPWIDDAFVAGTVAEIVERLRARPEPEAAAAADTLGELSPTALTVALAAVRAARELPDLRAALAQEYGLVLWFAQTQPDLVEGIRAQVVDKDRRPRWQPASLAAVEPGLAARALAWVPPVPLWD
ncbi:3-hydroxyisobutyryl-CoA hydrolase [Microbacterium sp.]|uniref:3-hydroxyisobutyryl-CoA hydrolase n=1 Tax=Microbacterium sp. TaxID=51671 RepID=UPI0039E54799